MTDIRWGVWYAGPTEYASKEEAEKQLFLAQMDVPARLIFDRGDGWRDAESEHRLGKLGLADDIQLVERYSRDHLPDNIDGAVVSLMGKLEAIEGLLESRRKYMQVMDERSVQALIAGDSLMSQRSAALAVAARSEIGRLEGILYDCSDG